MYGYIYKITNNINGKTYIGQHKSVSFEDKYMGSGVHLKRAQNKYGIENFTKTIVTFGMSQMELDVLEKFYIEKERKENLKGCYNIAEGGHNGATTKGRKLSDEHRNKISNKLKGRTSPMKGKTHIGWNKGMHHSEETKRKISEAAKGHKPSFCRPRTEEEKEKMRAKIKGRKLNLTENERLARANRARELSKKNVGRKRTEETKRKMSEAAKRRLTERGMINGR